MKDLRERVVRKLSRKIEEHRHKVTTYLQRKERETVGRSIEWYESAIRGVRDLRAVPIVINNRNRLAPMLDLIAFLERSKMTNIFILDNDSRYPPLLDYYRRTRHNILYHGANRGPFGLWSSRFWRMFRNRWYVYTDPDVVPCADCPSDFIEVFYDALRSRFAIDKVGFGLRIDDLPDHANSRTVIEWERVHWDHPVDGLLYDAPIDTTFALYRPRARGGWWCRALRTGGPYLARHMPWYSNPAAPSEEEVFYARSADRRASHYLHSTDPSQTWGHVSAARRG